MRQRAKRRLRHQGRLHVSRRYRVSYGDAYDVDKTAIVMIMDAKYLGSCPTGMKPGDLIMDGKIISGGN